MPLHLLGKKSWNVYNADNIARVQHDEAAAAAAELAAEQRMQDADAARRLAILRGETPPPLPQADDDDDDPADNKQSHKRGRDGASGGFAPRKRKRAGEDDTDFEMRVAREQAQVGARVAGELGSGTAGGGPKRQKQKEEDVNIVDKRGHIDLVGPPPDAVGGGKNAEYEREAAQKKREAEFGITMRFADAAGRDGLAAGQPWYVDGRSQQPARAADTSVATREDKGADIGTEPPMKNVWGKDDPKRRGRDTSRMNANDPLAAMRAGAKKVRDIEKERRRDAEERKRELKELRGEDRREDRSLPRPHRSERSERKHDGAERHERRHRHGHREERRHRRPEDERDRDRDNNRHHGRETERSRERENATRSHRDKDDGRRSRQEKDVSHRSRRDMDDSHHHREKRRDSRE